MGRGGFGFRNRYRIAGSKGGSPEGLERGFLIGMYSHVRVVLRLEI